MRAGEALPPDEELTNGEPGRERPVQEADPPQPPGARGESQQQRRPGELESEEPGPEPRHRPRVGHHVGPEMRVDPLRKSRHQRDTAGSEGAREQHQQCPVQGGMQEARERRSEGDAVPGRQGGPAQQRRRDGQSRQNRPSSRS